MDLIKYKTTLEGFIGKKARVNAFNINTFSTFEGIIEKFETLEAAKMIITYFKDTSYICNAAIVLVEKETGKFSYIGEEING